MHGRRRRRGAGAHLQRSQGADSHRRYRHAAGPRRQGSCDRVSVQAQTGDAASASVPAPIGLLAELTHRCPLQCPYCSNPLELERVAEELPAQIWTDVLSQAAALGLLQVHLSGGEPTVRSDLEEIVAGAAKVGLYCNLITSA